jgi:chemotaxis protein MotB
LRQKRHFHAAESANQERWLLSYSDFITLLFAFFVVLYATTYRDNQAIKRLSHAIHKGFQSMGAFSADEQGSIGSYAGTTSAGVDGPSDLENGTTKSEGMNGSVADLRQLRKELEAAIGTELKNHEVVLQVTPEGFVISLKELGFFDSGEATLLPGASAKLARIAKVLSRPGLEIRVEGHSDDQPIHTDQFRSNWELSTARAMNVLLLLVNEAGFDPRRISASGFGQYRPIADNSTVDGRRMNRRVDLVVVQARYSPAPKK